METVTARAVQRSGLTDGEEPVCGSIFYRAVDELELELQSNTKKIQNIFEEYGLDYPEELNQEEFTTIAYGQDEVQITYGLLLEVYNEVIRDTFDEKLNEILAFMDRSGIFLPGWEPG